MAAILPRGRWVNTRSVARFRKILSAILDDVIGWKKVLKIVSQRNFKGNISNFVVSIMPADGLVPPNNTTSTGTAMTRFRPCKIAWHT